VIEPINGDPFVGFFETPVTSAPLVAWYLSSLPAYRTAVNPLLRGVEIGLAHGYLLVGPFVLVCACAHVDDFLSAQAMQLLVARSPGEQVAAEA